MLPLQYLTFTTYPTFSIYGVQQVCQFMRTPTYQHLQAAKRILRYIRGTFYCGIHFTPSPLTLFAFS